jgi:hypothetical protein
MTLWTPVWSVLIDGVEYKNITLANLTIESGRRDIYQQAVAGYCSLSILNIDDDPITVEINSGITVFVQNSAATPVAIFGGSVSDILTTVERSGTGGLVQTITVTALGALSRLPKVLTEGILSKDFEGDQIFDVLDGILYGAWNEVPAALHWSDYDATTTWANAENSGVGQIDRPGNYELTARSADVTDAYSLVSALATSGLGYIYEDSEGRIGYADSTRRGTYLAANGYVDLSALDAYSSGLQTSTRAGDVRNSITITYKNGQLVTDDDPASIALYGSLAQNIQTSLEKGADATTQAAFYLTLRAYPRANFESIRYPLGSPNVSDADRDSLINVFMGMPVNITDLPVNMGLAFQGFVEGWRFSAGYNSLAIDLYVTPIAYSLDAFRWNDVPASETWNSISPTLTWLEATVVA